MKPVRHHVSIIDDDPAVSDSIEVLLSAAGYDVSAYTSGVQFLHTDLKSYHGCILLDVRMPKKDGLTVLSEALDINPNLAIVMMSGHGDIPMAVRALKLGAIDFIEKPFQVATVLEALQKASRQAHSTETEKNFAGAAKIRLATLTPREIQIAKCLVDGKPNKIIAFDLGISIRTVETHRARILSKLQVRSLADLVKIYISATP